MADTRTIMTKEILAAVDQQYSHGQYVFKAFIKRSVRFAESAVAGKSILSYDPTNPGAEAYQQVAQEIVDKTKAREEEAKANSKEVAANG
jgi:chromosome partitioning protein